MSHELIKASPLPELPYGQVYSCDQGCGDITPVILLHRRMTEHDLDGNLINSITEEFWGCPICKSNKAGIYIYNEDTDELIGSL